MASVHIRSRIPSSGNCRFPPFRSDPVFDQPDPEGQNLRHRDSQPYAAELSEMLTAWAQQTEKLRNGEINREDYDK